MDKEEQYLLFALSAPMEVLNNDCVPSHSSPKMYLGMSFFDLHGSWGINNREELIQTIYQMTNNGHAGELGGLYNHWFLSSPQEWRSYVQEQNERGRIYARFVAETAMCCGEGGIRAWNYVRMGFLCRVGVLNNWLTEEESLWLQSRIHLRALRFYRDWICYFAAYLCGRLYWQTPDDGNLPLLRRALADKTCDESGDQMFVELAAQKDSFYAALPWRPFAEYPGCPATLKDISDL